LESQIEVLNSEEDYLERQIKETEVELQKIKEIGAIEEEIERSCIEYRGKIEKADFELKKRILKKWVKEINLPNEGGIVIKVRIPEPEKPAKLGLIPFKTLQHSYTATSEEL